MPSVAWACAITGIPAAVASAIERGELVVAEVARAAGCRAATARRRDVRTLITSAPARMISRTRLRISSGPSTMPGGRPGCGDRRTAVDAGRQPAVAVAAGLAEHA